MIVHAVKDQLNTPPLCDGARQRDEHGAFGREHARPGPAFATPLDRMKYKSDLSQNIFKMYYLK